MITCPVTGNIPLSVSLTLNPCDYAENNLKIIDNQPVDGVKKEFGVCVKQLTYPEQEFSIKFIEWVHMLQILGNSKIHFYNRFLHPETLKAVKYFEGLDLIEMFDFIEPSELPNEILRTLDSFILEAAVVNDCFYRVKNLYKFVAILDPDEFIMPLNLCHRSWHDLIKSQSPSYHVYSGRMITFPPMNQAPYEDIPKFNYMLQNVQVNFYEILMNFTYSSISANQKYCMEEK